MRRLWDLAHARAGDKGSDSLLVLRPYAAEDFTGLVSAVTAARVAAHFRVPEDAVTVTALPGLGALTLVLRGALAGGVTRSGRIDPHGKTLSGHLLDLRVPWRGTGRA